MVNCPIDTCNGSINVERGQINAEIYGSNVFTFTCPKCKSKVQVSFKRTVQITGVYLASNDTEDSF